MRSAILIVPGSIRTLSGGYGYDRQVVAGLRDRGWSIEVRELYGTFPLPDGPALEQAARALAEIADGSTVLIDGLALGAMPDQALHEAARLRLVAILHHPLAEETGLGPERAAALVESETRALGAVRLVIVTSQATAQALGRYRVSRAPVVAEPGTDPAALARGSGGGDVGLLCVAALVPRKGHDILFSALAQIPSRNWRLTCVGGLDREPAWVGRLRAQLEADHLAPRVRLVGEAQGSELERHYDVADVFVLPTWHEGYGMALAEALARGIPVITTPTGGVHDLVTRERAGLVVPAGDVSALAKALSTLITDRDARAALASGARFVRALLPTWDDCCTRIEEALVRVGRE